MRNCQTDTVVIPVYIPTNGSLFPVPCQHLLSFVILIIIVLPDVSWYLTVVMPCLSLVISDAEHLVMYPLAIWTSSFSSCCLELPFSLVVGYIVHERELLATSAPSILYSSFSSSPNHFLLSPSSTLPTSEHLRSLACFRKFLTACPMGSPALVYLFSTHFTSLKILMILVLRSSGFPTIKGP